MQVKQRLFKFFFILLQIVHSSRLYQKWLSNDFIMKKHSQSNVGCFFDFSGNCGNRSFTPVIMKSKNFVFQTGDEKFKIVSEKKYSILNVPKQVPKETLVFKETNKELKKSFESSEILPKLLIQTKSKTEKIPIAKLCNIRRTYRSPKNPNQENLKAELLKLENRKDQPTEVKINKVPKSDIEKLLESQNFSRNKKFKTFNKPELVIDLGNVIQESKEEIYDNKSNRSDPSPKKTATKIIPKSQTPTIKNNVYKNFIPS